MKTVKKKDHAAFIRLLHEGLTKLGAAVIPNHIYPEHNAYHFEAVGLTLSPDNEPTFPGERFKCLGLTCFGRFDDPAKVPANYGKSFSGKWNFHIGVGVQPDTAAAHIISAVRSVISENTI